MYALLFYIWIWDLLYIDVYICTDYMYMCFCSKHWSLWIAVHAPPPLSFLVHSFLLYSFCPFSFLFSFSLFFLLSELVHSFQVPGMSAVCHHGFSILGWCWTGELAGPRSDSTLGAQGPMCYPFIWHFWPPPLWSCMAGICLSHCHDDQRTTSPWCRRQLPPSTCLHFLACDVILPWTRMRVWGSGGGPAHRGLGGWPLPLLWCLFRHEPAVSAFPQWAMLFRLQVWMPSLMLVQASDWSCSRSLPKVNHLTLLCKLYTIYFWYDFL